MKWNSVALSMMIAGAVIAFPSSGMAQSAVQNSEAHTLWEQGVQLQNRGRLAEAAEKFREALAKYPRAEQADRTAYFLIDTLVKLRRLEAARSEINQFLDKYKQSPWMEDVVEFIGDLGGIGTPGGRAIWNSPEEVRAAQLQDDLRQGRKPTTFDIPETIYPTTPLPMNADIQANRLRQLVMMDPEAGIETAKDRLKSNPSDPAVLLNLSVIANNRAPQRVPFLLSIWANPSVSPNGRKQAFFWYGRTNPDKEAVAKEIMNLLESKDTEAVASDTLAQLVVPEHRKVLQLIASSSRPNKFDLLKKIYQRGSQLLKSDLLMVISELNDPNAAPFLVDVAQTEMDPRVRQVAVEALMNRKDVDPRVYQRLRTPPPPAARAPQLPMRLIPQTSTGSNFASGTGSN